ncbi:MAG: hypothetical protein O2820_15065 [Planctomycetota bacterium]|nr:hypothetical protein [Planctomycetota bacterium]MDA1250535.1 hypothetical protein [Planctomycetota bacterium]
MYMLGQLLPVGMVISGVILILLSEGSAGKSGFAIAGALLIGFAYLGLINASKNDRKPE